MSVLLKTVSLLALCFLALFPARLQDVFRYLNHVMGHVMGQVTDPAALDVATLREILEERGVDPSHLVEKAEFVDLVKKSDDDCGLPRTLASTPDAVFMSCQQFDMEAISDTSDIWLVRVVNSSSQESPRTSATWSALRKRVTRTGLRTGIVDCQYEHTFCAQKNWLESRIVLMLPRPRKPEDDSHQKAAPGRKIRYYSVYDGPHQLKRVLHWLKGVLEQNVIDITSLNELQDEWMTFDKDAEPAFRAVYLTDQQHPPGYFAALSLQYEGIVEFGVVRDKRGRLLNWIKRHEKIWSPHLTEEAVSGKSAPRQESAMSGNSAHGNIFPTLLILSREGTKYRYGRAVGECLTPSSVQEFFQIFTSYSNTDAKTCFLLCNVLLITWAAKTKRVVAMVIFMILCNAVLLFWWGRIKGGEPVAASALSVPWVTTEVLGSSLHRTLLFYTQHPSFLALALLSVCCCLEPLILWMDVEAKEGDRNFHLAGPHSHSQSDSDREDEVQEQSSTQTGNGEPSSIRLRRPHPDAGSSFLNQSTVFRPIPTGVTLTGQLRFTPTSTGPTPNSATQTSTSNADGRDQQYAAMNAERQRVMLMRFEEMLVQLFAEQERVSQNPPPPGYIDRLPTWTHPESKANDSHDNKECIICLEDFCAGQELCSLPCAHSFHLACIRRWLTEGAHSCPFCRAPSFTS